jgi:hypothetical protein
VPLSYAWPGHHSLFRPHLLCVLELSYWLVGGRCPSAHTIRSWKAQCDIVANFLYDLAPKLRPTTSRLCAQAFLYRRSVPFPSIHSFSPGGTSIVSRIAEQRSRRCLHFFLFRHTASETTHPHVKISFLPAATFKRQAKQLEHRCI